jgi:hypothetical protein
MNIISMLQKIEFTIIQIRYHDIMIPENEKKILRAVNLSPNESIMEKLPEVHPMKQVVYASVIQVLVFGFMIFMFWLINQFVSH